MKQSVDAIVVTCMDARLHRSDRPYLAEYLRSKHVGLHAWDLVSLPGAARGLVKPESQPFKDALLRSVKAARDLHGVRRVFLINHSDCGAYGGAKAFPNAAEEYQEHAGDLRTARDVLREFLLNLEVRLYYATIEDRPDGPFITFDEVR